MGGIAKQISIYIGLLLVCSTFTLISPFYPKIAEQKGLPLWLIGMVFSANPLANLIASIVLGKYMNKLGRKNVVMASFILSSFSMIILSPIESCDKITVIVLSFLARSIGGIGAGAIFTAVVSVFVSDYPQQVQVMIGRMEAAVGIGLIFGPLIGTALSLINLMVALNFVGGLILLFSPIAWKMLGTFQEYKISEIPVNRFQIFMKPKIFLTCLMDVAFLFCSGTITTILEIHLSSFNVDHVIIASLFVLVSAIYFLSSLTMGTILKRVDERICMFIGTICLVLGYLMLGPCWVFPKKVWVIFFSMVWLGLGQSLTYLFSIPYMLKSAINDYGYPNDDILTDIISSFCVVACSIGEILGPLYSGFASDFFGIENTCNLAAIMTLVFGIIFTVGCGVFSDLWNKGFKESLLRNNDLKKIKPLKKELSHLIVT